MAKCSTRRKSPATRPRVFFLLKLSLGIGLLAALLLWNDNWRRVLEAFASARPYYLIPFLAITLPLMGTSCLKWGLFLREQGICVPFHRLFGLYMMGNFFNNFLPGMMGGDVVRAYMLGRQIDSHTRSIASVALERITGMVALVSLAIIFFLFDPELRRERVVAVSIVIMGGGCAVLLAVLWRPGLAHWLLRPFKGYSRFAGLLAKVTQLHDQLLTFRGKPALVLKAMAYSYLFHVLTGVNVYLAALVLDIPLGLIHAVVLTPIIVLVAAVPVSVNGLGVWEWAFSFYLLQAGIQVEQGLAVALILRAKSLLISLLGGLVFLAERGSAKVPKVGGTSAPR